MARLAAPKLTMIDLAAHGCGRELVEANGAHVFGVDSLPLHLRSLADAIARASRRAHGSGLARAAYAGVALDIEQALERVRLACTLPAYADVVQVACLLLSNIQKYPEERGFRSLRLRNQLVHTRVAVHEGGLALLRALGFALGDVEADEPLLLLEEPDVQRQFEEWAGWFERLKANIARLEAELRTLRVAPLPTAVKGAQQLEPTRGRRQGPQVATLHGSSGRSM